MVVRRERKSRKLRGRTRTMGWGRIGQHRKAGARGGKGAAGLDKHEWTWTIKYAPHWYGKRGFTPRRMYVGKEVRAINVDELSHLAEKLMLSGEAKREGEMVVIDLSHLGYHKLLGNGKIDVPVKVIVESASEEAIKKVESAGGKVILTKEAGEP